MFLNLSCYVIVTVTTKSQVNLYEIISVIFSIKFTLLEVFQTNSPLQMIG